jgi:hypothetical protein
MASDAKLTEREFHQEMAVGLFNEVWRLLKKSSRSLEEDDRMVHAAHASRFHWEIVGNQQNLAIGEWQIARVYSVLQRTEPALHHAWRCLAICEANNIGGFYLASAYEGLARALAGNADSSFLEYVRRAKQIAEDVVDASEKAILLADLEDIRCRTQFQ